MGNRIQRIVWRFHLEHWAVWDIRFVSNISTTVRKRIPYLHSSQSYHYGLSNLGFKLYFRGSSYLFSYIFESMVTRTSLIQFEMNGITPKSEFLNWYSYFIFWSCLHCIRNLYVGLPYFSKSEKYLLSKLCSNFSCIAIDKDPLRIALQ